MGTPPSLPLGCRLVPSRWAQRHPLSPQETERANRDGKMPCQENKSDVLAHAGQAPGSWRAHGSIPRPGSDPTAPSQPRGPSLSPTEQLWGCITGLRAGPPPGCCASTA